MKVVMKWSLLALCHLLSASAARANFNDVESGTLLLNFDDSTTQWVAPVLSVDVTISVSGPIVRTVVTQSFRNPGVKWANATYVFPLPETAAVDHMRLETEKRIIEGQIKEKAEAKKIYNDAMQAGKKASLVSQSRNNLFTTRLANLPPGETMKVQIEYQHPADRDGDTYSLRFPMTITPRYIPGTAITAEIADGTDAVGISAGTDTVPNAADITPPWHVQGDDNHPTRITVDLQPGFRLAEVNSRYHPVKESRGDEDALTLILDQSAHLTNADFVVEWQPAEGEKPQAHLFSEHQGGEDYHLLMITPPSPDLVSELPPRELVFVVDTSGSMGGESIRQAKKALAWALERLRLQDSFNIIEFNSGAWSLFGSAQPASPRNIARGQAFVSGLEARGGTEMRYALDMALCGFCTFRDQLRQVIFLTDGAVGNEDQLFNLIKTKLGNSRLFTVGIGSAPNSFFMRKSAEIGRGTFTHIGDISESAEVMARLFATLEKPMVTQLQITGDHTETLTWLPDPLPDVYAGRPIVAMLKGQLPETLKLTGKSAGRNWRYQIDGNSTSTRTGIQTLWGRQEIEALMDEYRYTYQEAEKQALRQKIVESGLKHHLVSAFTSLVAIDISPSRPATEKSGNHIIANNSPKGTQFGLTTTATPAGIYLISGFLSFLLAFMLARRRAIPCD